MNSNTITVLALAFLLLSLPASCSAPHQHAFGEWTADGEVNCMDSGIEKRSCSCGAVETRTVPAKGVICTDGTVEFSFSYS